MLLGMTTGYGEVPIEIPVPELRGMTIDDEASEALLAYSKGYPLYINTVLDMICIRVQYSIVTALHCLDVELSISMS